MVVSLFSLPPAAGDRQRFQDRFAPCPVRAFAGQRFALPGEILLAVEAGDDATVLVENAVEHRRRLDVEDHHLAGCLARVLVGAPHGVEREHERRIAPPVAHPLHVHARALVVAEHVGHEPFHERGEVRIVGLAAPHSRANWPDTSLARAGSRSPDSSRPRSVFPSGAGSIRVSDSSAPALEGCRHGPLRLPAGSRSRCRFPRRRPESRIGWVPPRAGLPAPRVRSASARLGPAWFPLRFSLSSGMCGARVAVPCRKARPSPPGWRG